MKPRHRIVTLSAVAVGALSLFAADIAEARRGGSFGSRGMRTYTAPPPTRTAPSQAAPIQRSMTPQQPGAQQPARAPAGANAARTQPRTGMFSNPLVRGLLLGGLIGALLGFGFGGMGGMMAALLQVALFALAGLVLFKLFSSRRRRQPASAFAGASAARSAHDVQQPAELNRYFNLGGAEASAAPQEPSDEIGVTQGDLDTFEALLKQVQTAFGSEDYGALRSVTTPEIMSYLSEELSQNATQGRRNEVTDITLDQGDLAEAWREGDTDYATVAMRYSSRDVTRDRTTGRIIEGDPDRPTQTVELWTFVRSPGQAWKLSAIQDA